MSEVTQQTQKTSIQLINKNQLSIYYTLHKQPI